MIDNFLQRLEEKVMVLLTELESLRKEISQLRHENSALKTDKLNYTKKLQTLLSLLDSLEEEQQEEVMSANGELRVLHAQEEYGSA